MGVFLRIRDCDDGASTLDVVKVPEGFSFQIATEGVDDYQSVIVSEEDARRLSAALRRATPPDVMIIPAEGNPKDN